MRQIRPCIRMHAAALGLAFGVLSGLIVLGVSSVSGSTAWADGCTAPAGGPSGADAAAFTYQCDGAYAGEWTSPYYAYDPASSAESPLYSETYRYDCTSDVWQQNEWDYDATSGTYEENWVPAVATPDQPTGCPAPAGTAASSGSSTSTTTDGTSTAVNNTVGSASQSGKATVVHNGQAGGATSGNSTAEVTVGNVVSTTGNALSNGLVTFTTTLGDVNGDFVLDPSTILPTGTAAASPPPAALSNTNTDTSITNTITASAVSGDAVVAGNGDAGDATSGNADAIVNLINIINSAVASGQSFIGTINITGDMNGNILIPQSVVDQLLASNNGGSDDGGDQNVTSATDQSIVNNVNASAVSGDAKVAHNGQAGGATTGQAGTNVTVLNLTGSSVIGKNVLLVFVNVLGKWVGMIMNAPAGATSAEFGGGISSSAPSSGAAGDTATTSAAIQSIVNNVNASAVSGDAKVVHNHEAGSAQSGDAYTAVNILNVENSTLSLANWFGILFINVFGTWNGSFGIQPTPAPAAPQSDDQGSTGQGDGIAGAAFAAVHRRHRHFATFVPTTGSTSAVLGDATAAPVNIHHQTSSNVRGGGNHANYVIEIGGVVLAGLLLLAAERDKLFRRGDR